MNNFYNTFDDNPGAASIALKLSKEQKDVESCKSSFEGNLKVGFQLLFLLIYLQEGVWSYKRNIKGRSHLLFNLLLQLSKAKKGAKGCLKELPFFLMHCPYYSYSFLYFVFLHSNGGVLTYDHWVRTSYHIMWLHASYITLHFNTYCPQLLTSIWGCTCLSFTFIIL